MKMDMFELIGLGIFAGILIFVGWATKKIIDNIEGK